MSAFLLLLILSAEFPPPLPFDLRNFVFGFWPRGLDHAAGRGVGVDSERLKLTFRGSMGSGPVELHGAEDDLLQVASGDAAVVSNRALV